MGFDFSRMELLVVLAVVDSTSTYGSSRDATLLSNTSYSLLSRYVP